MAKPQPSDAHLRVAHSIGEQLMVSHFSEQQRRILDLILRLSWGCGKKDANIPHQRDFAVVGIREGHIKAHLDWLIEAKVIIRQENNYQFNKDFDQWRVSRAIAYTPQKLTELVRLNLNYTKQKLTENGNSNLRNTEESAYGKRKLSTPTLVSPKEKLKKVLKKDIYVLSEFTNIQISKEEHQKLIEKFGEAGTVDKIENLSLYIASKGDKYKSHYATILSWDKKDQKGGQGGENRQVTNRTFPRDGYHHPKNREDSS